MTSNSPLVQGACRKVDLHHARPVLGDDYTVHVIQATTGILLPLMQWPTHVAAEPEQCCSMATLSVLNRPLQTAGWRR